MRSSPEQYELMVDFMEANGDLSKPTGGPRGRHFIQMKWRELTMKLNRLGTGDPRSEEKWRKVWSDFKNNTKKKFAKVTRASKDTSGGPPLQLSLTDVENRVIQIIGGHAGNGVQYAEREEAEFQQVRDKKPKENDTENERVYDELELERLRLKNEELRLREIEVKERIRQRDEELRLQACWLELMKNGLEVFERFLERK